jgi:hypothetical protein
MAKKNLAIFGKKIHVSLSARHGRPMLCIGYVVVLLRARDLANWAVEVSKNIGLFFLIHWAKASETLILACCNEISDGVEDMFVAWFVLQLISFCSFKGAISSVQKGNTSIVWEKITIELFFVFLFLDLVCLMMELYYRLCPL